MSSANAATRETALREVMNYLSNKQWDRTTPELATSVHRIVKKVIGNADPYSQLKEKYNHTALALYPKLLGIVEASEDPLLAAAKVAITGNIIDFGPKMNINLEKDVEDMPSNDLAINDVDKLKGAILRSKKVLYLADNAGETVFDRILIEELLKQNVKVTCAVKDAPVLNDATFQDAKIAGITKIASVTSIGTDCMDVLFRECSPKFLNEFEKCAS
jgi:uncharacterized protein with ATP-grasp and redox domains